MTQNASTYVCVYIQVISYGTNTHSALEWRMGKCNYIARGRTLTDDRLVEGPNHFVTSCMTESTSMSYGG